MRMLLAGLSVVCVWASVVAPASAGWDNVFQPTLFERWRRPTVTNYYVAPAVVAQYAPPVVAQYAPPVVAHSAPCDPCQKCTTNYVQRSYYQPVTTMETRTIQEQVTTMQTSYYYAPVTTYRYSAYYDPCSCSYQQVAVPQQSYELRAKSCPVQSWVSRCVQVPVQSVQKVDYWQPVTTCCSTTLGAPIMGAAPPAQMMPQAQPVPELPPSITGQKTPAKPTMMDQYYYQPKIETPPEIRGNTSPSSQPKLGLPLPPQVQPQQPPVKLDRIAVGPDSHVDGQVVRSDSSPKANAKVLFINASTGKRQTVVANTAGRFQVDLPAGSWHVYTHGADDVPIYQNRIDVNGAQNRQVTLVSRSN
ncbi:MAG: carboxypeptidase regulatory-like domain-containing protein [Planctomycetes bacterium]|nr:carboxypeptidase regulatory-like domain-containing protein [Planctomycetota bacterium]